MLVNRKERNIITWAISLAFFVEAMDATILNTSLPQIAHAFMVNPILLKVVLISYLLSVGLFLPLSSYVADKIGTQRLFILANFIFCLGSIGSGFSHNITMLTIFRIIQGLGGAFLTPVARLIMVKIYPKSELTKGQAFAATLASIAMLIGPLLGGAITTYINWRFIFFINIPVNLLATLIAYKMMPNFTEHLHKKLDLIGYAAIALSLVSLLFFFDTINSLMIGKTFKLLLVIIPIICIWFYVHHSKKNTHPLFDNSVWKQREIIKLLLASFIIRIAFSSLPFLIPLILQSSYGFTAFDAGLILICSALGFGAAKAVIMTLTKKFSTLKLLQSTHLICFICFLALTSVAWTLNWWLLGGILFINGLCQSITVSTLNVKIYQKIPSILTSQIITLNSSCIQLSASFSIAIAASFLIIGIGIEAVNHLHIPLFAFHYVFIFESIFIVVSAAIIYSCFKNTSRGPTPKNDLFESVSTKSLNDCNNV